MKRSKVMARVLSVVCLAVTAASCSGTDSLLPTSPSGTTPSGTTAMEAPPSRGATILGKVKGASASTPRRLSALTSSTMTVKVVGTNITAPVSPSGSFLLESVPAGNIRLEFTATTGPATTTVVNGVETGDRLDLEIRISGSMGLIESSIHIKANSSTVVEGEVDSVSGTCPNRTVVVNDWTLQLDSATRSACSSVKVGVKIKIKGTLNSQKIIIVVRVEIKDSRADDDDKDSDSDSDSDRRQLLQRLLWR